MSTSLPKIKILIDNSETGSQKQLKFKKIKLNSDTSVDDLRDRFKSVRTQRLNSIQRYSTVEGQRQQKKQKIYLNLLQRKLMSGTYDEKQESGNDLNTLKQKTDSYKTHSTQKQLQTQKLRQLMSQIKIEIQNYKTIKNKNNVIISNTQKKHDQQKNKTQNTLIDKSCLQHMIVQRKKVNLFYGSKIMEDKAYLVRLQAIVNQTENQLRETTQNMRNLQSKIDRLNQNAGREQKNRQQAMYDKQSTINKRTDDEIFRQEKSVEYKKGLDVAVEQTQKKEFMNLYEGILCHIFVQKYSVEQMESLENKYRLIQNGYNKISSYKKFNQQQPMLMVQRHRLLPQETQDFQLKIKELEKKVLDTEKKHAKLLQEMEEKQIISKGIQENPKLKAKKSQALQESEIKSMENQRKIEHYQEETKKIYQKIDRIERWGQQYAKQLQIKSKKGNIEEISKNIQNILKIVLKEKENIEQRKVNKEGK